jgi:membrane associated rhomboid family serine protease
MGPVRFVLFYLVCGLTASFAHIVFGPGSEIPAVGASGAISGVLGGYLLLFPGNRVRVLTQRGIAHVPAMVVLGFWILIQFVNGIGSLAATTETGGVAYMAHIGGFLAGLVLVKLMASPRRTALA